MRPSENSPAQRKAEEKKERWEASANEAIETKTTKVDPDSGNVLCNIKCRHCRKAITLRRAYDFSHFLQHASTCKNKKMADVGASSASLNTFFGPAVAKPACSNEGIKALEKSHIVTTHSKIVKFTSRHARDNADHAYDAGKT